MALAMSAVNAIALQAGLTDPEKRSIAIAIATAESGRRPDVVNSIGCVGLWQINSRVHKTYTVEQLKDPAINAKEMMRISNGGTNWNPWTVYTGADTPNHEKTYLKYMAAAKKEAYGQGGSNPMNPAPPTGAQQPGETIGEVVTEATGIPAAIDKINAGLRNNFLLALPVIIALVLIVLGVIILNRQLVGKVAGATPVGRVAKLVK